MTRVSVREMRAEDISQAAAIHRRITRSGMIAGKEYPIHKLFTAYLKHTPKTCMVAEIDGTVVGFIVGEMREWSFGAQRTGWIEIVEVDPRHMGAGIGRMLGRRIIEHFKGIGAESVHTAVAWDSGDLLSFFKGLGFERSALINLERRIARKSGARRR
ncbi:MAG: GNAT family N-acetyltransferase [Candidatus Thermoplasmatota archaeon]